MDVKEALQIPVFYRTLIFFFLSGMIIPSFSDIMYYFNLEVIHLNKSTISLLALLGFITLVLGTMIYNRFFKKGEFRTLIKYSVWITILDAVFTLVFVLRFNLVLHINDIIFMVFTSAVTETLSLAFTQMPTMVIYAKITPPHIEATVFAFLTGTHNFSRAVLSPMMGAFYNHHFVGVTSTTLDNFYILIIIYLVSSFVPLFLLWLIPLR